MVEHVDPIRSNPKTSDGDLPLLTRRVPPPPPLPSILQSAPPQSSDPTATDWSNAAPSSSAGSQPSSNPRPSPLCLSALKVATLLTRGIGAASLNRGIGVSCHCSPCLRDRTPLPQGLLCPILGDAEVQYNFVEASHEEEMADVGDESSEYRAIVLKTFASED